MTVGGCSDCLGCCSGSDCEGALGTAAPVMHSPRQPFFLVRSELGTVRGLWGAAGTVRGCSDCEGAWRDCEGLGKGHGNLQRL